MQLRFTRWAINRVCGPGWDLTAEEVRMVLIRNGESVDDQPTHLWDDQGWRRPTAEDGGFRVGSATKFTSVPRGSWNCALVTRKLEPIAYDSDATVVTEPMDVVVA